MIVKLKIVAEMCGYISATISWGLLFHCDFAAVYNIDACRESFDIICRSLAEYEDTLQVVYGETVCAGDHVFNSGVVGINGLEQLCKFIFLSSVEYEYTVLHCDTVISGFSNGVE